jgi:4-carboxymuconolactone decarboxylase
MTMDDTRTQGLEVFNDLMPGVIPEGVTSLRDGGFAQELSELSVDHIFGSLWTRPGLGRRDRSLVTVAALIAMRANDELRFHLPIALRNGVTLEEIEEVVYHLAGYAGFPAANAARSIGREVIPDAKHRRAASTNDGDASAG